MCNVAYTMYIVGLDAKGAMWKPVTLGPDETVLDARDILLRYGISRVVIAKNHKPLGIVTEKDIARFLYEQVPPRQLDEIRLDEVMSRSLVTVGEETDLRACAKVMLAKGVSSLVVVDGKKNLKGIFTKTDLTTAYVEYYAMEHRVREFMTKKVITVAPDEPVHSAIMLMIVNKISRIVVTRNGRLVGMITGRDLLPLGAMVERRQPWNVKKWQPFIPAGIKAAMLVSDVMTPNPVTTTADSDLADAGYIMLRNRISGLPVVDSKQAVAGIVTKTDVVKALASHA
ncbi:putative inosine-5'-monophosphate dehydrogenase protein [Candidatus Nitrososphaera gargensis Ga9.2]|uniref:Putative inosine-5'-monophosphate dehydrogenase protein n=2 Tax=Candidatus Nitrososphaera gargensis TaxID=497727 RepID=K0IKI0_NITGG|nr:putative inosine-5'-monophosphate dehydrogenase protein [Candidatus Nitrososphaera gargensis Ga9.2]